MKQRKYQSGIGLIEAMIAAVVFAIGIVAVVQLQGVFFQNSSNANARSIAMGLAQERLEEHRSFLAIEDYQAIQDSAANENIVQGNTTFTRNWDVTDYYYDNAGSLTTVAPAGVTIPDQKRIEITVAWTDSDNSVQAVNLEGLINRNSGASAGGILSDAGAGGGSGESPIVPYTPSEDVQVTPIGVGDVTKRETLVPSSSTVDGYSRTRFIANTYTNIGGGSQLVRQEEFQNVACDCRFNSVSTENNPSYSAAHPVWDEASNTYIDVEGGEVIGKTIGCVQGGGNNCAANPDPACAVCCRDHHDSSQADRKYDPYRSTDDFSGGNHNHYLGENVATSGSYLEACRMKRINGFWWVYQDWNLVDFTVLTVADLENPIIKENYANYVANLAAAHIDEGKFDGQSPLVNPPSKPSAIDHTVSGNYVDMSVNEKKFLSARAVYLDFIDSEHLQKVQEIKTEGNDYLLHVPFYEIEVASVALWASANPTTVRAGPVSSGPPANQLLAGQLHAMNTNSNAVEVTGVIKKSNSGIVALNSAIDFNAATNADSVTMSDAVHVCVGCSAPIPEGSCPLPWGGTLDSGESVDAYQYQTRSSQTECDTTLEERTCTSGTLSGSYEFPTCTVSDTPSTCTTTISGTAGNANQAITISVNGNLSNASCTYSGSGNNINFNCTQVSTALDATITVTRHNTTLTLTSICGSQTVNF